MVFNFDAVRINQAEGKWRPWTLPALKAIYDKHANGLSKHVWDTVFLANHDNPRLVSSFGDDSTEEMRVRSAKLLQTMLLTLRGTPFLYQGDELGMTNYPFAKVSDFDDIQVKNAYKADVLTGHVSEAAFLENNRLIGRDNARTPMQWSSAANAGFTTAAHAWLAVNPNYKTINAADQLKNPDSIYHYTQQAIALHRYHAAFVYGDYEDLDPANPNVFAYTRTLGAERFLVALNFGESARDFRLPDSVKTVGLLLGNLPKAEEKVGVLHLRPWEARVYRCRR